MVESLVDQQTAWGLVQVGRAFPIRSYDGSGNCFSFQPKHLTGWRYALDVEERLPRPECLVSSELSAEGLSRWVEVEVVAKLLDTPAHIIFRQTVRGCLQSILNAHRIEILRCDTNSHWIAIGRQQIQSHVNAL